MHAPPPSDSEKSKSERIKELHELRRAAAGEGSHATPQRDLACGSEASRPTHEEISRLLFSEYLDPILVGDVDTGVITECNPAAELYFGYPRETLIGMHQSRLHPPEEAAGEFSRSFEEHRRTPDALLETKLVTATGEVRFASVKASIIDSGGKRRIMGIFRDVTERKRLETEQAEHLWRLKGMDAVERAIRGNENVEAMLDGVVDTVLKLFQCDRAWLFYPCDPGAPSFRVPIEHNRPEYPGAMTFDMDVPMSEEASNICREALATDDPVLYGPHYALPVPADTVQVFKVMSQMVIALHPKRGKPWMFGMHQCSHARSWTAAEQRLFKDISHRVGDALNSLLILRELRASEEKYRSIFENALEGLFQTTPEGALTSANPALAQTLGYDSPEEAMGSLTDVRSKLYVNPEKRDEMMRMLLREGEVDGFEFDARRKDGTVLRISLHARPVYDEKGRLILVEGIMQDVTDRARAEERLANATALLNAVIEQAPIPMVVASAPDMILRIVNPACREILGIEDEEPFEGKHLLTQMRQTWKDFDASGEPVPVDRLPLALALRGVSTRGKELRVVRKDGSERWEVVYGAPIYNDKGELIAGFISFPDITENKKAREFMVQTEKMMSVGGLAAGMAHEINNPLGIILASVQNCLRRVSPEFPKNREAANELGLDLADIRAYLERRKVLGFIDSIGEAAERAARIVKNMLDFSRRSESSRAPHDINNLLDKTIDLASNDYDLKKKYDFRQIEILRDYAPDLPDIPVAETEIEQVALNILKNAAHALCDKEFIDDVPRIRITTRKETRFLAIEIADNGPGMDEATRKRVFEPFFTTKPPGLGAGLGLSVSYFIVTQNHHGRIEVASSPGGGAAFTVRLPLE